MSKLLSIFIIVLLASTYVSAAEDVFWFRGICVNHGYSPRYTPWTDERLSNVSMFPGRTYLSCDGFEVQLYHVWNTWDESRSTLQSRARIRRQQCSMTADYVHRPTWHNKSNYGEPDRVQGTSSRKRTFAWDDKWGENYWAVHNNVNGQSRRVVFNYDDGRFNHEFIFVAWSPAP